MCSTPLGSPTVRSNWSYVHVPAVPCTWRGGGAGHERGIAGCGTGGYTGWVIRGSTQPARTAGRTPEAPSEAGPEAPQGLEWWGAGSGRTWDGGWAGPGTTPAGPGRSSPAGPPCTRTLRNAASWPYRARIDLISYKVSQNSKVSPKSVEKA